MEAKHKSHTNKYQCNLSKIANYVFIRKYIRVALVGSVTLFHILTQLYKPHKTKIARMQSAAMVPIIAEEPLTWWKTQRPVDCSCKKVNPSKLKDKYWQLLK